MTRTNVHRTQVAIRLSMFAVSLASAGWFAVSRPDARAETMTVKDAQQEEHLHAIDSRLDAADRRREIITATRDKQIEDLRKDNSDMAKQLANDEGKAEMAFAIIAFLAGGSVFVGFKTKARG